MASLASTSRGLSLARTSRLAPILRHASTSASASESSALTTTSNPPESSKAAVKRASGESWLGKQMEMMQRLEKRKQKAPVKADDDIPFGFTPLSERWLVFQAARIMNWYQTLQAGRGEFGFWSGLQAKLSRGRREALIEEQLVPLYTRINEAYATGDMSRLQDRISSTLEKDIRMKHAAQTQGGRKLSWRLHRVSSRTVESMRQVEYGARQNVMQMNVRFKTTQSLEVRDRSGRLISGSHDRPEQIIENYVFQKRIYLGASAPWTAIKSLPTLTPLQAVGSHDKRFYELLRRKKRTNLTVVA